MRITFALLSILFFATIVSAQAPLYTPQFELQVNLPGSNDTKFPHSVLGDGEVHIASNANRLTANYWSQRVDDTQISQPLVIGSALEQPDYSSTSIARGSDRKLYYAWINQPERTIYLRVRDTNGQWGPNYKINRGSVFPVQIEIASSDRGLFALWRNPDRPFVYSRSLDSGLTWSRPVDLSERAGYNAPAIGAGADGHIAVAYAQGEANRLQIFAGLWDGQRFVTRQITSLAGDYADPSVAVLPSGRAMVAWRGVDESGASSGVFLAEQMPNDAWPIARMIAGKVTGRVNISADSDSGLHLLWIGEAGGVNRIWYSQRSSVGVWTQPIDAPYIGGHLFNAHASADASYAYGVSEVFYGSTVIARMYRFSTGAQLNPEAKPVLDGGALFTKASQVELSFTELSNAPSEVRWRWGSPPHEQVAWQTLTKSIKVTLPKDAADCQPLTLYTQVRNASSQQQVPGSAQIRLDRQVQATVQHFNQQGAAGYTNHNFVDIDVNAEADCSGLAEAKPTMRVVSGGIESGQIRYRLLITTEEGEQQVELELSDSLGNEEGYTISVVVDRTAPEMGEATQLQVSPHPAASIIQQIRIESIDYQDASGEQPWGIAIAARRTALAEDNNDTHWHVLAIEPEHWQGEGLAIDLSLATLMPDIDLNPGSYHYYVRLVDRAGNMSGSSLYVAQELDEIGYIQLHLPMAQR